MKTNIEKWILPKSNWTMYVIHVCSKKMPEQIWIEKEGKNRKLMFGQGKAGKRGDILTEQQLQNMGYTLSKK